jgi:hypothetical protein
MMVESPCLVGEVTGNMLVLSAVGPTGERGEEVMRIMVRDTLAGLDCDLSPDGGRIAVRESRGDTIRILDVRGDEVSMVVSKNPDEIMQSGWIRQICWAASGRGFFLSNGSGLFYTDFAGHARELYRVGQYGLIWGQRPSPDGRHIAFSQRNKERNAWLVEHY